MKMRLKYFYLGLLSVLAGTQIEGAMKQTYRAPQIEKELEKAKDVEAKIAPNLNLAAHGNKIADASQDVHDKLGAAHAPSGVTTNHRITDLHATLGVHPVGGAPADHANKRAEDVATRIGGGAPTIHEKLTTLNDVLGYDPGGAAVDSAIKRAEDAATRIGNGHGIGPTIHAKLTALLALQGAVSNGAAKPKDPNIGLNPNQLAGSAIKNEEAILNRLKTGLGHLTPGKELRTVVNTKTADTVAANAPTNVDVAAAMAATNIEDLLAELGW